MPSSPQRKRGIRLKTLRTAGTVTAVAMLSLGLVLPSTAYGTTRGLMAHGGSLHGSVTIEWGVSTAPAKKDASRMDAQSIKGFEPKTPASASMCQTASCRVTRI